MTAYSVTTKLNKCVNARIQFLPQRKPFLSQTPALSPLEGPTGIQHSMVIAPNKCFPNINMVNSSHLQLLPSDRGNKIAKSRVVGGGRLQVRRQVI